MARNKDFSDAQKASFALFGGNPNGDTSPADDISSQFKTGRSEKIQQIGIFEIYPDGSQPRRAMPSAIRSGWNGDPVNLPALYGDWLVWIGEDYRALIMAILDGQEFERPADDAQPPAEIAALIEIATLAGSIRRDGLMNPVTVAKITGGGYQLESGERRWLAYHLLHHTVGKEFSTIPVRVVESVNRWRQAAENNTRSDLNAIGRARQFAVLLMDLIGAGQFAPFDQFANEQDFYAQVADGEAFRIPRGAGERLVAALGMKNSVQLRQYRALLRLSPEVWRVADDQNWTEKQIRTVTGDTVAAGDTVTTDTVSDSDAAGGSRTAPTDDPVIEEVNRFAVKTLKKARRMDKVQRNQLALIYEEIAKQLRAMR